MTRQHAYISVRHMESADWARIIKAYPYKSCASHTVEDIPQPTLIRGLAAIGKYLPRLGRVKVLGIVYWRDLFVNEYTRR